MQLPVPKWESARHRSLADILSPASGTATASDIMHPNLASQTDRIDGKSIKWGTIERTESIKRCLSSAPARTRAFATPSLTRSVWLDAGSRRCRHSPAGKSVPSPLARRNRRLRGVLAAWLAAGWVVVSCHPLRKSLVLRRDAGPATMDMGR